MDQHFGALFVASKQEATSVKTDIDQVGFVLLG
jgi:hypothetical protein